VKQIACHGGLLHGSGNTAAKGPIMNQDTMAGNWKQMKGKIKEQWGKLTDDDLDVAAGKRDQLLGKIQERYGVVKEEAEKQMTAFEKRHMAAAK
jgi:uncharacterized protein YjbJ (UPF0337 family)